MAQSTATKGFLFLVFFQLVIGIQSVELNKCQQFVTDKHIKYLDDMIDNQMESPCTIKVKLLKRKHLSDYCYIRGSVYVLGDLLRKHMLFKINSISFNRTQELTQLYNNGITECVLKNGDSIMRKPKVCSETKDLSLAETLETVRELFKDAKEFREKFSDHHNCAELYKECEEEDEGKEYPPEGPSQCDCPSPSEKPVFPHSPHPSSLVLPTFDTTEEMNLRTPGSYPYKPTAPLVSEPNTETASLISTDLSTESVFQHKREYPQDTTILQPSSSKDLPHARTSISPPHDIFLQVTMESPKGPTMPLFGSMQTTGTKTSNLQVTTEPLEISYANTEQLQAKTMSLDNRNHPNFDTSHLFVNTDLHFTNELLQSPSTSPLQDQNLLPKFNKDAYGAFSFVISAATKMRRSVETSEKKFKTVSSSSGYSLEEFSASLADLSDATEWGSASGSHSYRPLLHGKETKGNDLGWAAATPSASSISPSKSIKTGHLETTVTLPSKTIVNEGHLTQPNILQREESLAVLTSQNSENHVANPRSDFNLLPIIETEPINDENTEQGLWGFFLPLIFILGLLISGLLCYRKYRRRSRLNGDQRDPEIPEERALQNNFMEMNDL